MSDSNIVIIFIGCALFFTLLVEPALERNKNHELIIKCMEKDTPANCALILKKTNRNNS